VREWLLAAGREVDRNAFALTGKKADEKGPEDGIMPICGAVISVVGAHAAKKVVAAAQTVIVGEEVQASWTDESGSDAVTTKQPGDQVPDRAWTRCERRMLALLAHGRGRQAEAAFSTVSNSRFCRFACVLE